MTEGVLLIHAFPVDARMWEPQLAALGDGVPVVAPHLPGFGGTPRRGDVMSMGSAAARCLEALDAAGVNRAVVCGLSMGRLCRVRAVAAGPRAVRRTDPREHPRRSRHGGGRGGTPWPR
ncbi:MAG: alpha/beta fold hydrolase [Actinomycetota bacterium]